MSDLAQRPVGVWAEERIRSVLYTLEFWSLLFNKSENMNLVNLDKN